MPTEKPGKKRFDSLAEAERAAVGTGVLAGRWTYYNRDGSEHSWRLRIDEPDGDKRFISISRKKKGFVLKGRGGLTPIYRLPDVCGDEGGEVVHLVEGEKCADALVNIGLCATTTADGAGNAGRSDLTPLAGRDVVVLPDADDPGRAHARDVARRLLALDPPAKVRIVEVPGLDEGEDIADWLAERHGTPPAELRAALEEMAAGTAEVRPEEVGDAAVLLSLADVQPEPIRWLWPGRIAIGKLTILAGLGGSGKSTLLMSVAATVTAGTTWPDGSEVGEVGSVLLVAGEDDPADTVRPRLELHGANLSRVQMLEGVSRIKPDGTRVLDSFTLADVARLDEALARMPDCRLVVIDPMGEVLGKVDAHKEAEVRSALRELRNVAARRGVAVVIVTHVRKGAAEAAQMRILGSVGAVNLCRQAWMVLADPDDPDRRLLVFAKGNIGTRTGLAFRLVDRGGDHRAVSWEQGVVEESADDVERRTREAARDEQDGGGGADAAARASEAVDFLRAELAAGPVPAATLKSRASEAGLAWVTIKRVKREAGVVSRKEGGRPDGRWIWSIEGDQAPDSDPDAWKHDPLDPLDTLPDFVGKTGDSGPAKVEGEQGDHPPIRLPGSGESPVVER